MTYIVYHIASTRRINTFKVESSAKRSTTCANRNAGSVAYAYASEEDYNTKVVKTITVKNLMTGAAVEIPSDTPWCCRPDSETYWSM
jgi:hypothetical protein